MIELQSDFINIYVNGLGGRYNNINKQENKEKPSYAFLEEETVEPIYKNGELHNNQVWNNNEELKYQQWLKNKDGESNE